MWREIEPVLEGVDFLAAHNAGFDRGVLAACSERYGLPVQSHDFVCSVQVARWVWGIRRTRLRHVCAHLDIPLNTTPSREAEASAPFRLAAAVGRLPGGERPSGVERTGTWAERTLCRPPPGRPDSDGAARPRIRSGVPLPPRTVADSGADALDPLPVNSRPPPATSAGPLPPVLHIIRKKHGT